MIQNHNHNSDHDPRCNCTGSQEDYFESCRKIIAEFGVLIQYVMGDATEPPFAYTVGLAAKDHPELIIFGLSPDVSRSVLNHIALPIVHDDENARCQPGPSDQVFKGTEARFIEVVDSDEHLTVANSMFAIPGQGPLDALQIVYPDADGVWPWESGSKVASEPLLGIAP